MRKIIIPLAISVLTLVACQQELDEVIFESQQKCRLTTGYYFGGGGVNDSAVFTYTGNKVTRADESNSYVLYNYTGDNITLRKIYDVQTNELLEIDSISYSTDNKITKMVSWYYQDPFLVDTTRVTLDFFYTGTRLDRVKETDEFFSQFGNQTDVIEHLFTTNEAGNIEKLVFADANLEPYDSILYSYDTHPNYFKIVHPHFFLFDPYFQVHAGFTPHLAYFYSKNNVSNFDVYGGGWYDITYGLDSTSKVTAVDMDGFEYMKYKYECD